MSIEKLSRDLVSLFGMTKTSDKNNANKQHEVNQQIINLIGHLLDIIKKQDIKISAFENFIEIQGEETLRQSDALIEAANFIKSNIEDICTLEYDVEQLKELFVYLAKHVGWEPENED